MLDSGFGAIVNVSSVIAHGPFVRAPDYSASKAALSNLTKSLSEEFAKHGIRTNTVSPGPILTPSWERDDSTLNAIAQLKDAVGNLERVRRIVRLEGSINIAHGYTDDAPKVLNGASETLNAVFGERGRHSRMIYTFPEMLLGVACLIVLWAEVD